MFYAWIMELVDLSDDRLKTLAQLPDEYTNGAYWKCRLGNNAVHRIIRFYVGTERNNFC